MSYKVLGIKEELIPEEKKSASVNAGQEYFDMPEEVLYSEERITADSLKTIPGATSSVDLPAGYYAEILECVLWMDYVAPAYSIGTLTEMQFLLGGDGTTYSVSMSMLEEVGSSISKPSLRSAGIFPISQLDGSRKLWYYTATGGEFGETPTLGGSDLVVKVRYRLHKSESEL